MKYFLFILPCFYSFSALPEEEILSRIDSHFVVKDYSSAIYEVEQALKIYPKSLELLSRYILSLCEADQEQKALKLYKKHITSFSQDTDFLENLSWKVLYAGAKSTSYSNRLLSLLTAQFSSDSRATQLILSMMKDPHALLRLTATRLATKFCDAQLKDEILSLAKKEKHWEVRLQALDALGKIQDQRAVPLLKEVLEKKTSLIEEKMAAISSLVYLYDSADMTMLEPLFTSDRVALRLLAVRLALHFEVKEAKEKIVQMVKDPIASVRMSAIYALGMYFRYFIEEAKVKDLLDVSLQDINPKVGILSAYAYLFIDPKKGYECFFPFFHHEKQNIRIFATSVLSHSGKYGVELAEKIFAHSEELCMKMNLAIGLAGQRKNISSCCDVFYHFLTEDKNLWMLETTPFFQAITFSNIRYTPISPNYPIAVDQMTRLEILSYLGVLGDSRALQAARALLKQKNWQIKGALAVLLLREGEEDAQEVLYKLLEDKDPNIQLNAALILAIIAKDEAIIHTLHSFYWAADYNKKIDILEAIGHVGSKESIFFLSRILYNPSEKIRLVAASSLIRCLDR